MNSHFHRYLTVMCLGALGVISCALGAQQAAQSAQPKSPSTSAVPASGQTSPGKIGFPYSADEVMVRTQTLADGTKITHKFLTKAYRDSQGRTRREGYEFGEETVGEGVSPEHIQISDPVAGFSYSLNPRDHTAQKREMRRPPPSPRTIGSTGSPPSPRATQQPTSEDLGTQVIEGLEARGLRTTRTIPAGAEGNDRPIQITEELWHSDRPSLMLMKVTNDPRYGETVMRLTNLVLAEPSPDLFQVPPDYTIQELQPVAKPESPSE